MNLLASQLLVCLGAAYVLGEFVLRSDRTASTGRRLGPLLRHSLLVAAISYALCGAWTSWVIPLGVLVTHALVDALEARAPQQTARTFLAIQVVHGAALFAIALLASRQTPTLAGVEILGPLYLEGLILLTGLITTLIGGSRLISLAVAPLLAEMSHPDRTETDPDRAGDRGFAEGGKLIGRLERGLILLFVLTGQPSSIGFLIAAKSVFRFGELSERRNRMETEYIIIGTMLSFTVGLLVAYATRYLLGLTWF